jgi:transposase
MGESKNISKMVKRVGNALRFFQFNERLKYKCEFTNTKHRKTDEAFTSKCCCKCGTYYKNLGSNKRYKCINPNCNLDIGRDINGAINIFINSLPI